MTKAQNKYQGLPAILKTNGYYSSVFHGNNRTFWNREEMYKSLGYDMFYDSSYYNMTEENVLNYGLKDKPFFKETMPYLTSLPQPFYAKLITLSNHFPYPLDEALKQLFDDLRTSGLDKNTMVVMYGDHYGNSENRKKPMSKIIGKEIDDFEQAQLQRVPLFIHAPGLKGFVSETYGGEIDVRSTVLHLLGINTKNLISFGSDLLSKQREQVVAFRNGDFLTDQVTSVKGTIYDNQTGGEIDDRNPYQKYMETVKNELQLSDKIVYADLLRFYNLESIEMIDRSQLDYSKAKHLNDDWQDNQQ